MNRTVAALVGLSAAVLAGPALGGPLTPPAGAVAPTGKTLASVEPRTAIGPDTTPGDNGSFYRISQPGSYYLTGDVVAPAGKRGIEIAASNVTLDLNGFRVVSPGGDGIVAGVTNIEGISVRNGGVTAPGGDGIDLNNATACMVSDMVVTGCAGNGIMVNGSGLVERCITRDNAGDGLRVLNGSIARACVSRSNHGRGAYVIWSTLEDSSISVNTSHGVESAYGSVIRGNSIEGNGFAAAVAAGIQLSGHSNRVEDNHIMCGNSNDFGIVATVSGNFIVRNSVRGVATANAFSFGSTTQTYGAVISNATQIVSTNAWANFVH